MSRLFFFLAFAIGLAVTAWIGQRFLGSDLLALSVTAIIALVYGLGFIELMGFRRTTRQLAERIESVPQNREQLESWLCDLPEQVQFAVQKRIDGYFAALPSPQLTPYLVGLLVMLGLLGTFAGMIVTLGGAASALDGSTDLSVIRGALAAPIAGLSLAFGTSIAGVAASAMLGLASTLSRRERLQASRQLDKTLRQRLHHLSTDYQRQQAFKALESQATALPQMATAMESMTARMEQLGQQMEQSLTRNQQAFHNTVGNHYQTLADSVAASLERALQSSARQSAERIVPIVTESMTALQTNAEELHKHWSATTKQQLEHLTDTFRKTTHNAGEIWQQNLLAQQQAAAQVISQLQSEMARNSERENELLKERQRLVQELDSLLESQRSTADSQRHTVDSLISGAGDTLSGISERFNTLIQEQSQQLGKLGEDITGSSQEVGALSEAFHTAVDLFSASNTQLQHSLTNIQAALDSAGNRHDKQLAYYVAQAREVIDLSVSSQKDVIDAASSLMTSHAETSGAS